MEKTSRGGKSLSKIEEFPQLILSIVKRYKYPMLILILGLALLMIPSDETEDKSADAQEQCCDWKCDEYARDMEERLKIILSNIEGVGRVDVCLTLKCGEQKQYLFDREFHSEKTEKGTNSSDKQKAVILSQGSAYDEPTVTEVDYPQFQGALIVCEGGAEPEIKLLLSQAVSALTNLSSDRITITKMK